MQEILIVAGMLAGGLGLFLIAVGMITDGLKLAAGDQLRELLGHWTRSPAHGIATGFTITAIVQSSSAVTVATIGFVNAGLLTLYQALGIIFGANIGTTMTGWLVAIIGFKLNVDAFAMPMIGIGMLLRLTDGTSRRGAFGMALAGFGLFFIGIDVLKEAFEGMVSTLNLERFTLEGVSGLLMYLGIGFLMTVLTQSSSAAIAITLAAVTGGVVGIYAGAAMVIGANVGTTSTAVFSVLGATSNAKRVAAAHVLFNGITAVVALALMPVMFEVIDWITALINLERIPAVSLALFHTTFNVLGVALMWPFSDHLARFLARRFTSQDEILGRPQFLDKTILVTPTLALNAAVLELQHLATIVSKLCFAAIDASSANPRLLRVHHDATTQLAMAIGDFILQLQRSPLPKNVADGLPSVLRSTQYLLNSAELAMEVNKQFASAGRLKDAVAATRLDAFRKESQAFFRVMETRTEGISVTECEERLAVLNSHYEELKEQILETSGPSGLSVQHLSVLLEQNSDIKRMTTQFEKGISNMLGIMGSIDTLKPVRLDQEPAPEEQSVANTESAVPAVSVAQQHLEDNVKP